MAVGFNLFKDISNKSLSANDNARAKGAEPVPGPAILTLSKEYFEKS